MCWEDAELDPVVEKNNSCFWGHYFGTKKKQKQQQQQQQQKENKNKKTNQNTITTTAKSTIALHSFFNTMACWSA